MTTYPVNSADAWRNNLPPRCPHVTDWERNPEQRPNLCIRCRRDAGDPYAGRVMQQRYLDDELAKRRGQR